MNVDYAHIPIIPGFHPDPSICRTKDGYYLVTSSFEYAPGVPIFHSSDLLSWTQIGNVLDRSGQFAAGSFGPSQGVFAPTIRHHDGRFWMITTVVDPRRPKHSIIVTASDPAGPWSDPIVVHIDGIDPDIAWDEDDACYVTWCATGSGAVHIEQACIDSGSGALLETPRRLWSGTGLAHPEAPHVYRRGEHWYLLIAEGGTERGHCVSIARGPSIRGPFDGAPSNPILSHRSTTHPVQNTGHADLVELPDGSWAMTYLGVRPRGVTPGFHVNGRETFLGGVDWVDDWPVVQVDRFQGPRPVTAFEDAFDEDSLHPRWISPGNWPSRLVSRDPSGGLTLSPDPAADRGSSGLATRVLDESWQATISMRPTPIGAVEVFLRIDERHLVVVEIAGGVASCSLAIGPAVVPVGNRAEGLAGDVDVTIRSLPSEHGGPDDLELEVGSSGRSHVFGRVDGRYLSTEVAGGFTGRVFGVRATLGNHRLGSVSYRPIEAIARAESVGSREAQPRAARDTVSQSIPTSERA